MIPLSFTFPNCVPTSGAIPSELGNLESAKDLYLHKNQLTGTIPIELMVGKLGRSVEWFELSENQLTGTIPDALTRLRRVKGFHVDTNRLTGTIPDSLRNMVSLGMLSLRAPLFLTRCLTRCFIHRDRVSFHNSHVCFLNTLIHIHYKRLPSITQQQFYR